ncbi:hypothetical protein ABKN59_011695 [Abortiporus biennis]
MKNSQAQQNSTFLPPIDRRDVDGGSALVVNPSPYTSQSLYPPDGLSICITINGHKDIQPLPTNDREFVQWSGLCTMDPGVDWPARRSMVRLSALKLRGPLVPPHIYYVLSQYRFRGFPASF